MQKKPQPGLPAEVGFYSLAEVLSLYPVSKPTLYREIAAGRFPAQTRLSPNRSGWWKPAVHQKLHTIAGIHQ